MILYELLETINDNCIVEIYRADTAELVGIYDGKPESEIRSLLTNTFNNAGFYNLNFVVKDTSKADNENGVESISPYPDGSVIDRNTTITIVILAGKTS